MTAKQWRGKWVADFTIDGERVRRVSPVQTKRGAQRFEAELRTALLTSAQSSERPKQAPRLCEFAPEWLTTYAVVNNKASEVVAKESILRVHLIKFFGNRRLDTITAREVERYKAEKLTSGLSAKSINNHLTVLRKLLATAEEWNIIDHVPRIRRLKTSSPRTQWLTLEETSRFLAAIEQRYPQWAALFWMAVRTGLRRGELFSLHWDDVDLEAQTVTIRHSVYRGILQTPKNGRVRTIPMTSRLAQRMRMHHAERAQSTLVFPGKDGALTTHQDHVDRPFKGALKLAGLKNIRFHDLRHSFASQLVSAGRSLKEVQELLGHQSIQMTMRYAHLAPERMRDAVSVLELEPAAPRS